MKMTVVSAMIGALVLPVTAASAEEGQQYANTEKEAPRELLAKTSRGRFYLKSWWPSKPRVIRQPGSNLVVWPMPGVLHQVIITPKGGRHMFGPLFGGSIDAMVELEGSIYLLNTSVIEQYRPRTDDFVVIKELPIMIGIDRTTRGDVFECYPSDGGGVFAGLLVHQRGSWKVETPPAHVSSYLVSGINRRGNTVSVSHNDGSASSYNLTTGQWGVEKPSPITEVSVKGDVFTFKHKDETVTEYNTRTGEWRDVTPSLEVRRRQREQRELREIRELWSHPTDLFDL